MLHVICTLGLGIRTVSCTLEVLRCKLMKSECDERHKKDCFDELCELDCVKFPHFLSTDCVKLKFKRIVSS